MTTNTTIHAWPEAGVPFKFDGLTSQVCPLCHIFIAKNVSMARRLPRAIAPITPDGVRSALTGQTFYKANPKPIKHPTTRRWFVHDYCWPKYLMLVELAAREFEHPIGLGSWVVPDIEVPTEDDWTSAPTINLGEYLAQVSDVPPTCTTEGCDRPNYAVGHCVRHYPRRRKVRS